MRWEGLQSTAQLTTDCQTRRGTCERSWQHKQLAVERAMTAAVGIASKAVFTRTARDTKFNLDVCHWNRPDWSEASTHRKVCEAKSPAQPSSEFGGKGGSANNEGAVRTIDRRIAHRCACCMVEHELFGVADWARRA
jgi:hypothetical protein